MSRLVRVLAVIAGVLIVISLIYASTLAARGKQPFRHADKATGLEITYKIQHVKLVKQANGWTVETSSGARPADPARVGNMVSLLAGVSLHHVLSESPALHDSFEVSATSATSITLTGPRGKTLAKALFGKQAPDYHHFYFRYADQSAVYLASGLFRGEVFPGRPEDWLKIDASTAPIPSPHSAPK